jgi:hypothetical protein
MQIRYSLPFSLFVPSKPSIQAVKGRSYDIWPILNNSAVLYYILPFVQHLFPILSLVVDSYPGSVAVELGRLAVSVEET